MRIEWKIDKKRGNIRPVLTYSVSLAEHEKTLALPPIRVNSSIAKPEEHWQEYCYPGRFERSASWSASEYYDLELPSHQGRSWTQSLRLPWRADNSYPEVEESFLSLRAAFENELAAAHASLPMQEERSLETSTTAKIEIAPGVLAERFLNIARKNAGLG